MLLGRYHHTIDAKGRVIVPARFREDLGEKFMITRGLDKCLSLYSMGEWSILEEKIKQLPMAQSRQIQRYLFSNAFDAEIDAQGRIVVPPDLREFAGFTKDIVFAGVGTRAEMWDSALWDEKESEVSSEDVVEMMTGLGF